MGPRPRRARRASRGEGVAAEQLSALFFELMIRHKGWFNAEAAELDVSPIQARTLLCIDPSRPRTMSEVAGELGCGASNITGVIDKLEARELVARRLGRTDRRVKTVAMTRKGAALRKRLAERLARPAPWMRALPEADQRRLIEILRRALRVIDG